MVCFWVVVAWSATLGVFVTAFELGVSSIFFLVVVESLPQDYQIKAADLLKENRYTLKSPEGLIQFISDLDK